MDDDLLTTQELALLDDIERQATAKRRRLPNSMMHPLQPSSTANTNRPIQNTAEPIVTKLPPLACPVPLRYCVTAAEVDYNIAELVQNNTIVGFDIEWFVTYQAGQAPRPVALMQLCTFDACLLLHIKHSGVTPALKAMLCNESILKVGVCAHTDSLKVARDFGFLMKGVLDLSEYAYARLANSKDAPRKWSLSELTEIILKKSLDKGAEVRCGNWEALPLTSEQRTYAAIDAWASLALYHALTRMPVVVQPAALHAAAPIFNPDSGPLFESELCLLPCPAPTTLQPAKLAVLELHLQGLTVDQIAEQRRFKRDTAQAYLAEAILAGHAIRYAPPLLGVGQGTLDYAAMKAEELLLLSMGKKADDSTVNDPHQNQPQILLQREFHSLPAPEESTTDTKQQKQLEVPEDILARLLSDGCGIRHLKEAHFPALEFGEMRLALAFLGRFNKLPSLPVDDDGGEKLNNTGCVVDAPVNGATTDYTAGTTTL